MSCLRGYLNRPFGSLLLYLSTRAFRVFQSSVVLLIIILMTVHELVPHESMWSVILLILDERECRYRRWRRQWLPTERLLFSRSFDGDWLSRCCSIADRVFRLFSRVLRFVFHIQPEISHRLRHALITRCYETDLFHLLSEVSFQCYTDLLHSLPSSSVPFHSLPCYDVLPSCVLVCCVMSDFARTCILWCVMAYCVPFS